ncbi:hypothetical protein [Thomasclavelia spiroformis]|uniref:hypothetical protein n=1 Tax=Thomasclavelia spiroformis TaxID=29348 RepID=UPI0039A220B9
MIIVYYFYYNKEFNMKIIDYNRYFKNATKDDLMDLERSKFTELTKKELLKICYAMLSCLIDLKD